MAKNNKNREARSSTGVARADDEAEARGNATKTTARRPKREKPKPVGKPGVPGSKNDARRCTATANRTGERCRAAAIKGGNVCRVHGGSLPGVKKAAKERLLSLVEPALAALHKVLTNPEADDSTKVRAAVAILDRTGFRPGLVVEVEGDRWSKLLENATMADNRALGGGGGERELADGAALQLALDARDDAWRECDNEEAAEYASRPSFRDEHTVSGEVVQSRYVGRPPAGPTDPPAYWPEDARRRDA